MIISKAEIFDHLKSLYLEYAGCLPTNISPLPTSGSPRLYFRIQQEDKSVIGVFNTDIEENKVFYRYTSHFRSKGLNTPEMLAFSDDMQFYLLNDLGNTTLYNIIAKNDNAFNYDNIELLKKVIIHLIDFQVQGYEGYNPEWGYPKGCFDKHSIMWDLNYFKYSYLKPFGLPFNEEKLEVAFENFCDYLLNDDMNFFQYRDFQSRNIMVVDGELFFIDYQGGRKGPCLYDIASFLYQAKAIIPETIRQMLFNYYIDELARKRVVSKDKLQQRFPAYVLFRIIQTLGAYGYRGNYERKSHFLLSIPLAVNNLKLLINSNKFDFGIEYLYSLLHEICSKIEDSQQKTINENVLTIEISSFSFMNGYPQPNPEHGGGFIFDCRFLPNPGRLQEYRALTGMDNEVIEYLEKKKEVKVFISSTKKILEDAINNYLIRGFKYLSIGFGCTGGQHRSVYCANVIAAHLQKLDGVKIKLHHREILQ